MRHEQFKEWLQLSLYDELSEKDRKLLNKHLKTCRRCSTGLHELEKFHDLLASRSQIAVKKSALQDARMALRSKIRSEVIHKSIWNKLKGAIDDLFAPSLQVALSGTAILAVGVLIGFILFRSTQDKSTGLPQVSSETSSIEAGESQIANIRFLERDTQRGNVEFTFESVTPVHVRGNVNDENVQKVLARALVNDKNVGIRLHAVNMIGSQNERKQNNNLVLDAEVKSALITALLHDKNLGVRNEALDVLRNYLPDTSIIRAFLKVLADEKNVGLKIAAINSLDLNKYENKPMSKEILEMLKEKAQSDDNNYIKIKAKTALQEVQK